jgi:hypothetical protein
MSRFLNLIKRTAFSSIIKQHLLDHSSCPLVPHHLKEKLTYPQIIKDPFQLGIQKFSGVESPSKTFQGDNSIIVATSLPKRD